MLEVSGLTKHFDAITAVDGISFKVESGSIVSLLGPSGCGKTTTLRLIAGFDRPDAGEIRINGMDIARRRPFERNVGLLFQHYALFPHMSVNENVAYGLRFRKWPKPDIVQRTRAMLALVKLDGFGERYPEQLSGGQQQRVALARALATQPEVVLLDEPLSALDAKLRAELRVELKEILRKVGSTAIIVTHDQEEAMGMAERIVVLRRGRIQQAGTPTEIYDEPRNRFVAEFIGRTNWLTGLCERNAASRLVIALTEGPPIVLPEDHGEIGRRFDVGIRPERIDILREPMPETADATILKAIVVDAAPLGAERHIIARLESGERVLIVESNRASAFAIGEHIRVCFRAADCLVFPTEAQAGEGQ